MHAYDDVAIEPRQLNTNHEYTCIRNRKSSLKNWFWTVLVISKSQRQHLAASKGCKYYCFCRHRRRGGGGAPGLSCSWNQRADLQTGRKAQSGCAVSSCACISNWKKRKKRKEKGFGDYVQQKEAKVKKKALFVMECSKCVIKRSS